MAETHSLVTRVTTNTTGFKAGMDEVVAQLDKFNKALVDNQYQQRECNKAINDAKKKIKELYESKQKDEKLTEDEEKQLKQLNETIEQEKVKLSQLRTEQVGIRQAISETSRAVTENNDKWTVLKGTLANLASDTIQKLGASLANIARDVVQTGEQFSASMSEVGAISGATAEELAELEAAARLYGATTKFSATEAADALKYMALAGWNSQQAIAGLPAVLDLAAASGMDLGRASDIVTDYITAFGLEVEDASRFVDIMSYAMSNSNTTTEMLGEAYKNCAATAKSMGFSVEETTSALMTMANAGVKGGEAGTTLNTLMTRLATNTKGCADELAKYGVQIYDEQGKMHSLSEIMNGLISAFETLTQKEQANLSKMIAGTNQYAGFQTLMQGMSEKVKEAGMSFEDYTAALEQCEGTSNDMAKTMSNNLTGDIKTLQSALDELKLKLFDSAETPLRNLVKLATNEGIAALEGIVKNLKAVIPVIVGAATAMSTLKLNLTVGKIVAELTHNTDALKKAFQGLTVATQGATVAQEELNVAQSANVIGLVVTAVMSLISAFGTLAVITAQNATETDNANVKIKNYLENLENLQAEADKRIEDVQNESKVLKDLQKEYDDLRQKINPTIEDKSRLDTIAGQLANTLGISTQALKDKNDAYIDITGSVDEYIKKLEEQARLENATNGLKEAYTAYDKAKESCEEYSKKIEEQQEIVEDSHKHFENLAKISEEYNREHQIGLYNQNSESKRLAEEAKNAYEEFQNQQKSLDDLNNTWNQYYSQTVTATSAIIENKKAMGQAVDVDKEYEQRCENINIHSEKYGTIVSDITKKVEDNVKTTETATKKTETLSEKYERLNGLLEENEQAIKDVNDEIEQAMDSGDTAHVEELQNKLKDLNSENTTLKNRIKAVKDEIEKDANAIADAIENVENSMQMLQKAEKEVADNGKLSLNTLMSIQKKYPELIELVNDYVSGVKTEKDVIAGLKEVYEKDVENYNMALAVKKLKQNGFTEDIAKSVVDLVNELKDDYGIDVQNFANANEVKKTALESLKAKAEETQRVFNDFWAENNFDIDMTNGSMNYIAKDPITNEWRSATQQEINRYKAILAARDKAFDNYYTFDTQAVQNYMDLYKPVSADGILQLSGSGNSSVSNSGGSSGKNDNDRKKNTVTLSGYDVTATGDTYAKAYMTWVDRLKSLGKITEQGEIYYLEKLKERTDNTAEEIYQIDLKLYNARKKLADDSAKNLADIEKKRQDELQEKLNLAKSAYDRLVNGRIESLQKEAQTAKDTANAEIAALDKVLAKRKQAKADEERQKKIDFINAQLRYKQLDEFSRNELQRQKQDLLNEQAEIEFERNISAQQQAISERSDLAQNKSQQAIDGLNSAKSQFADHIAYLSGSQTYDQRVSNNTTNQNVQIIQNGLNGDQVVSKLMKALGVS